MINFPEMNSENMGGCSAFNFIPQYFAESIPLYTGNQLISQVVLKSGCSWLIGLALPQTLKFDENIESSEAGDLYKYIVSGSYAGQASEIALLFDEMKNQPFILDILDNNNKRRLLGSMSNPLIFKFYYSSKDQPGSRPEYAFSFTYSTPKQAPFYNPQ